MFHVLKIAGRIRMGFEQRMIPREKLSRLYQAYNPVTDIGDFIARAEESFPKFNCGLASVWLMDALGGKVVCGGYGKHNHSFLLLDGCVVDITADQYGGPKVYVGELEEPWSLV